MPFHGMRRRMLQSATQAVGSLQLCMSTPVVGSSHMKAANEGLALAEGAMIYVPGTSAMYVLHGECNTGQASPRTRQHNARSSRRKQCSPNKTKPYRTSAMYAVAMPENACELRISVSYCLHYCLGQFNKY